MLLVSIQSSASPLGPQELHETLRQLASAHVMFTEADSWHNQASGRLGPGALMKSYTTSASARTNRPPASPPSRRQWQLHDLLHECYDDLRKLARARTRRLPASRTLRTTGLVHDAFMRLDRKGRVAWSKQEHFFADMAQAMRDLAVEYMRRKQAKKRGGHLQRTGRVSTILDDCRDGANLDQKLLVWEALERLNLAHPGGAQVVFLRIICGMSMSEIAISLTRTTRTVERHWAFARTWLKTELDIEAAH